MPTLPDLRECVLVGAGQNTHNTIATHDVYSVGQFKDDQFQDHTHSVTVSDRVGAIWAIAPGNSGYYSKNTESKTSSGASGRAKSTTHGKQTGVLYYVWAD